MGKGHDQASNKRKNINSHKHVKGHSTILITKIKLFSYLEQCQVFRNW